MDKDTAWDLWKQNIEATIRKHTEEADRAEEQRLASRVYINSENSRHEWEKYEKDKANKWFDYLDRSEVIQTRQAAALDRIAAALERIAGKIAGKEEG